MHRYCFGIYIYLEGESLIWMDELFWLDLILRSLD